MKLVDRLRFFARSRPQPGATAAEDLGRHQRQLARAELSQIQLERRMMELEMEAWLGRPIGDD